MNSISTWSIRNPVPTLVIFLVLTLAGIVGFQALRVNNTPELEIPTVVVTVTQPGAAPTELETQVTRLVEDAVSGVSNVDDVTSTVNEGASTTMVTFDFDTDLTKATDDVRNAVTSIRGNLPAAANEPIISRVEASGGAILDFVADAPGMSPDELSWLVDNDISKAVLSVTGVSKIERSGGVSREIRVELDPDRLMALGVTAADVTEQLRLINTDVPGGRATIGGREQTIRTLGSAPTVQALADTRITLSDGRTVLLSDLGRVIDSWAEPRARARLDGEEVVGFSVYRSAGSSEVDVAKAVRARVAAFDAAHDNVSIREISSSTVHVQAGYDAALEALGLGALLAVAVVLIFLRDVRATLVSAVALPMSLIPTFAVMHWLDISLNIVTLLALSLVVGVLVDDAIVEIENIVRHMRQSGKRAFDAAIEAADEIGLAVVATTLTIVAVFLPVAFMPGMAGQFFFSFAVAACVSVTFSLLVARMLTPLMGAYLLKAGGGHDGREPAWVRGYLRVLRQALRFRWITLGLGAAFFAWAMMVAGQLPTEFVPATDRGRSVISLELAPGATLDQTDDAVLQATKILEARPEVTQVYAAIGTSTSMGMGGSSAGEVRKAILKVDLKPRHERALSQQEFEAAVAPELQGIPGARIHFGAEGQSGSKVSVTLGSDDPEALASAVSALEKAMRHIPGIVNASSTASLSRPELIITPKPDKAAELGVSATAIAETVNVATMGGNERTLPKFGLADRQIPIRVTLEDAARDDLSRIANLRVHGSGGVTVPLSAVADIGFGAGPNQIDRRDRSRSATVEGELAGITLGQAMERIRATPAMQNLPAGVHEIQSGDIERMAELFNGFAMAIGTGIVLMYVVLVLLFGSFIQPITILTALPLSLGGALGLLQATGNSLSVPALIGILLLMGIAAKNSILLVEYAIKARREHGLTRTEALLDAARKRARPIVMTSIAMAAGMMPIALGIGADAEFRSPMAIAVIGGLISSTALSLLFVPAVYTLMDGVQNVLVRALSRLLPRQEEPRPAEVEAVESDEAVRRAA